MNKTLLLLFYSVAFSFNSWAQDSTFVTTTSLESKSVDITANSNEVYKIKKGIDIPVTLALDAFSLLGMNKIYSRDKTPQSVVLSLNKNDIISIDRSTADNFDEKAKSASDKLFYGSMPLPIILMLDKDIRKDGLKIGLLYLQAMGATGTVYTSSAMTVNRFRPYVYNPTVPMDVRMRGGGKNSFISGHIALVATSTFFTAKVYSDYHPEFKQKWILYTGAGAVSLATGLLRIKAGEHFPTDVAAGLAVGTLSGILTPHFHKAKNKTFARVKLSPSYENNQTGFTMLYKLNP